MSRYGIPIWKKAPFIRPLVSLMTGIIVESQLQNPPAIYWIIILSTLPLLLLHSLFSFFHRFKFAFINGICFFVLFASFGSLLTIYQKTTTDPNWFGHHYTGHESLVIRLDEALIAKPKSLKANANVLFVLTPSAKIPVKGKLIVYFKKDTSVAANGFLKYGTQLLFSKSIQEIKNAGNPGSFDFKKYAADHGITHQVYLEAKEIKVLPEKNPHNFKKFIIHAREGLLKTLRKYITSEKERGLAEALLIGYKDDLDRSLVESYTNTGVVHVIAISGLHLGLIYWLLVLLLDRLKTSRFLRSLLIISSLWLFAIMAGAQPSVLRSALMFSCIVLGDSFSKKSLTLNTLACSAFLLLCVNPFWLWDVGFQLSYSAVLSIIIFMKPIYNSIYFKNKAIDFIWQLNAVTLAAQILTTPISIFHFKQFPNYFLLTNFVAVPLSSLILIGEILLCGIWFVPYAANILGKILEWLIKLMNTYIQRVEQIPYSLAEGLHINIFQTIILYILTAGLALWLFKNSTSALKVALLAAAAFTVIRAMSFYRSEKQHQVIFYNTPGKLAIDIVEGRNTVFFGDPGVIADKQLFNFNIKPARIIYRLRPVDSLKQLHINRNIIDFRGIHVLVAGRFMDYKVPPMKQTIDILVISGNPVLYIGKLHQVFHLKRVIFIGTSPTYKMNHWKRDCDSLDIPYHELNDKGAFVLNAR
jgi:competence protein ComEC